MILSKVYNRNKNEIKNKRNKSEIVKKRPSLPL